MLDRNPRKRLMPVGFPSVAMVSTRRRLRARLVADLSSCVPPIPQGAGFGVGLDGSVLRATLVTAEVPATLGEGGAAFPKGQVEHGAVLRIVRARGTAIQATEIPDQTIVPFYVQPVQDGVLVVSARCRWREGGPEKNAVMYGWDGKVRAAFTLGDGVKDVRVTPDGRIWASYFDEGVFGNYGWGDPDTALPIGRSGFVAFDSAGRVTFEYDAKKAGTDSICDAYAMNLDERGDAWVYFYTEFPIVRISTGSYKVWAYGKAGAHALAVRDGQALLFGGHQGERGAARVVSLRPDGTTKILDEPELLDPDGRSLADARGVGMGGRMFFFRDAEVFVLEDWAVPGPA